MATKLTPERDRERIKRLLQCVRDNLAETHGYHGLVRTAEDTHGIVDAELRIAAPDGTSSEDAHQVLMNLGQALDDCEELQDVFTRQKDPEKGWKTSVLVQGRGTDFEDVYRLLRGKVGVQTHYGSNVGAVVATAHHMLQQMREGAIHRVEEVIYRIWSRAGVKWTRAKKNRPKPPKRRR